MKYLKVCLEKQLLEPYREGVVKISLLNNLYVFTESEDVSYGGESTSHPVEKGLPISDHYKRNPIELSLSGKIVDNEKEKASDILDKLNKLKNEGSLIKYVGKLSLGNMQIQSISVTATNKIWNGYDVSISLKEVRIAKSAYDEAKSKALSTQQVSQGDNSKIYYTVRKGDCIWNIVVKKYPNLKPKFSTIMQKCDWIRDQNPKAFSRPKDYTKLIIGTKLYVGYR